LDCAITSCGQQTELHPSRMLSLPGQSPVRHEKLSGGLTCKMTLSLLSGFCQGFSRLKLSLPQIFRAVRFQNPPPPTRCGVYRLHHVRGPLGRSRGIPTASFPSMLPRPPRHFRSAISGPQVDTAGPLMGYSGIYRGHPPPALLAPSSSANGPWTGQGGRGGGSRTCDPIHSFGWCVCSHPLFQTLLLCGCSTTGSAFPELPEVGARRRMRTQLGPQIRRMALG